jgi:hypothetical protein
MACRWLAKLRVDIVQYGYDRLIGWQCATSWIAGQTKEVSEALHGDHDPIIG